MTTSAKDWRAALDQWLKTHSPKISSELEDLRQQFIVRFPPDKLQEMTLEEYAIGKNNGDNFCYWLEFKTDNLGGIRGGSVEKFGIWWNGERNEYKWNNYLHAQNEQQAFEQIRAGLVALVDAAQKGQYDKLDKIGSERLGSNKYSLRSKPLSLYFPDRFLPISQPKHLQYFLHQFGLTPASQSHGHVHVLHSLNHQLLEFLQTQPEFIDFDTVQMMYFLYDCFRPEENNGDNTDGPKPEYSSLPAEIVHLMEIAKCSDNILLYGPPGTGKTWVARHFAYYFLLDKNHSPDKATQYWQAVQGGGASLEEREQLEFEARTGKTAQDGKQTPASEYLEFVTFHQSFAYEDFC